MNKKIIERISLILIIIILFALIIFLYSRYLKYDNNILKAKINAFNTDGMLSIMIENGYGVGEYSVSTNNSWPEGYILNTELSKCENGSSIEYDATNKKIIVKATKSDKCYVYFDADKTLANYIMSLPKGESTGLYYHDANLTNGANDNSYRYSGGNYKVTTTHQSEYALIDDYDDGDTSTTGVIKFNCNGADEYVGFGYCGFDQNPYYYLAYDASKTQYTYYEASQQALKDGYIEGYINNYVCFGSDETTCPREDLYRIIGVIDGQVKLIKADLATTTQLGTNGDYSETDTRYFGYYKGSLDGKPYYSWNLVNWEKTYNETGYYNIWSYSELNKTNLNINYVSYLNGRNVKWMNMIYNTNWKVGGNTWSSIGGSKASIAYQNEVVNPAVREYYKAPIGLVYASDYGYGAYQNAWAETLNNYGSSIIVSNNWIAIGESSWAITRELDPGLNAFDVGNGVSTPEADDYIGVRPVFYLKSTVKLANGEGTEANPYRISE